MCLACGEVACAVVVATAPFWKRIWRRVKGLQDQNFAAREGLGDRAVPRPVPEFAREIMAGVGRVRTAGGVTYVDDAARVDDGVLYVERRVLVPAPVTEVLVSFRLHGGVHV